MENQQRLEARRRATARRRRPIRNRALNPRLRAVPPIHRHLAPLVLDRVQQALQALDNQPGQGRLPNNPIVRRAVDTLGTVANYIADGTINLSTRILNRLRQSSWLGRAGYALLAATALSFASRRDSLGIVADSLTIGETLAFLSAHAGVVLPTQALMAGQAAFLGLPFNPVTYEDTRNLVNRLADATTRRAYSRWFVESRPSIPSRHSANYTLSIQPSFTSEPLQLTMEQAQLEPYRERTMTRAMEDMETGELIPPEPYSEYQPAAPVDQIPQYREYIPPSNEQYRSSYYHNT